MSTTGPTEGVGTTGSTRPPKKRSLLQLLSDVPLLVRQLVLDEIESLKQEMISKLKALGTGAGLLLAAAILALFFIGFLLTAAVWGLSLVMPGWLAALLMAALLLVIGVIVGLIGYNILKKGIPPVPSDTIDGLQKDLNVIRGVGKRA
ncbi:MAG TPA: phage holin family protein [Galbitalea sp.]